MKARVPMPWKVAGCAAMLAACVALLFLRFMPAMERVKQARSELAHLELRSARMAQQLADRAGEADAEGCEAGSGNELRVPSEPDVPSFVAAARHAQAVSGVAGFSFAAAPANIQSSGEIVDACGTAHQFVSSRVEISFNGTPRQAGEFLDALVQASVGLGTESIRLSRESGQDGVVSVSATVTLYGIPR